MLRQALWRALSGGVTPPERSGQVCQSLIHQCRAAWCSISLGESHLWAAFNCHVDGELAHFLQGGALNGGNAVTRHLLVAASRRPQLPARACRAISSAC
jgi:hypothetical protein